MDVKKLIAPCAATVAVVLATSAGALAAAGTAVTVRIEGTKKTLLAARAIRTHAGWITTGGTPKGSCPDTSAAGALDVATDHKWGGTYSASIGGLEILSILGERHTFSSPYYWEIFVNNRAASVGACEQALHRGDRLLFAAVSQKTIEYPTAIRAPRHAGVNHPFTVKVVWFNAKGIAKPLKGAQVTVSQHSVTPGEVTASQHSGTPGKVTDSGQVVTTSSQGTVRIKSGSPGPLVIRADRPNYIRAAPVLVQVSG